MTQYAGFVLLAAIALAAAPPKAPDAGQSPSGRLTGRVTLTPAPARSNASAYDGRSVSPRAKPLPEAKNVVIYFEGIAAPSTPAAMKASIAQKDEQFVPHLVAVTAGSSVAFPNDDPFFHNVFSLSRGSSFNLGRYASGVTRSRTFSRPGIVKVFCELHSHMSAVVRVFDHPWFTVPDEQGAFAIADVPAGEHTVVAWHERIGERRDRVTIRPGQATEMNFTLPVLEPAK
ncbi:MAG TPA: carboxypeptidase regulatory-like domain-containing protein [Vicinamibacterales bacterium]|nr:carboxypeptidase regulatory-like domain-containing protein [Vicinamibacterales bacterium]